MFNQDCLHSLFIYLFYTNCFVNHKVVINPIVDVHKSVTTTLFSIEIPSVVMYQMLNENLSSEHNGKVALSNLVFVCQRVGRGPRLQFGMKSQQPYRAQRQSVNSGKMKRQETAHEKNLKAASESPPLSLVVIFKMKMPD